MLSLLPGKAQFSGGSVENAGDAVPADKGDVLVLSLDKALEIALSEIISVKVADKEVQRTEYAKKGTYAALYPQIDGTASYQRTIKKQITYIDQDEMSMMGSFGGSTTQEGQESSGGSSSSDGGFAFGRWNNWTAGVSVGMPLVNAQLWESLKISQNAVELAVEKARASRLDMVTEVKETFYAALLAKESFNVYKEVYENAVQNFEQVEKKYKTQKASEMEYLRSKTNVANAVPNVFDAENYIILTLWKLKAVIGIDLDTEIDVEGSFDDFSQTLFRDMHEHDSLGLDSNSTMKQLAIQAEQLSRNIKLKKNAYLPTLSLAFNYNYGAMANDFVFSSYRWTPYSFVALQLSIPIFSGGKRRSEVKQAENQYEQLKMQELDTERQLKIAIRNYLNTMNTNMKSFYSAETAVETAQKSFYIVDKSYNVGRSTITDLNDAQLALTQARLAKSQAIYQFLVAKAGLEQVVGADFTD